jgi:enterochelin esterase-like enzyme
MNPRFAFPRALALVTLSTLIGAASSFAADDYMLGPDSQPKDGVPRGAVKGPFQWESQIFPGTLRDYWVYVPAQYDATKPAALMVFQDGGGFVSTNGSYRAQVVFDNLIHAKEMPVTIGLFINPGNVPPAEEGRRPRSNRSFEYDSLGDQYTRFLLEEIIPAVRKDYAITDGREGWAICGNSSGGICAWTVAWERSDKFSKVLSHIGSFTNIRGGHNYPALIRKTEKKPIRVLLQDGSGDLDNLQGNWSLANQQMAAALKFMKYDYQFVYGDGGHNGKHGGSIFPDSLRWLWRGYEAE